MAIIMGIDPGSQVTGFGVLQTGSSGIEHICHGVILMPRDQSLSLRLQVLGQEISEVLEKYQPQEVSIEKIFLGKSPDSAFKLGHARGVVMSYAATVGAEVFEYATRSVKKGVAGNGSADKLQVKEMVMKFLHLKNIDQLDASDALALALHHARFSVARKLLRRQEVSL